VKLINPVTGKRVLSYNGQPWVTNLNLGQRGDRTEVPPVVTPPASVFHRRENHHAREAG
jgi:hypothetical protein